MKELSLNQMEMVSGGRNGWQCAGGIAVTAGLGAFAFFAPAVFMATMATGPGFHSLATLSMGGIMAIYEGC